MDFGNALTAMMNGEKVARSGWNGKGMFIFIVPAGWEFMCDIEGVELIPTEPFVCMKTAQDNLIPWVASQADMLAIDWEVAAI